MRTIGIAGGSGFVGRALADHFQQAGDQVVVFSRSASKKSDAPYRTALWDPGAGHIDRKALGTVNTMINLAGAGVLDRRWTAAYKKEIMQSRTGSTSFLIQQLQQHAPGCEAFISASATGYYGPDRQGFKPFREQMPPSSDFLGKVCRNWETAAHKAEANYRTVILRLGVVLGHGGGAYKELTKPLRFGAMPVFAGGAQSMPWIALHDVVGLFAAAVYDPEWQGVYNAVSPRPATNREVMQALARARGGVAIPVPVPGFVLRAMIGEGSTELLKSVTVSADKAHKQGYRFQYPDINRAARFLAGKEGAKGADEEEPAVAGHVD